MVDKLNAGRSTINWKQVPAVLTTAIPQQDTRGSLTTPTPASKEPVSWNKVSGPERTSHVTYDSSGRVHTTTGETSETAQRTTFSTPTPYTPLRRAHEALTAGQIQASTPKIDLQG